MGWTSWHAKHSNTLNVGTLAFLGPNLGEPGEEVLFQSCFFWYPICNWLTFETPSGTSFAVECDPYVVPIECWVVFS